MRMLIIINSCSSLGSRLNLHFADEDTKAQTLSNSHGAIQLVIEAEILNPESDARAFLLGNIRCIPTVIMTKKCQTRHNKVTPDI